MDNHSAVESVVRLFRQHESVIRALINRRVRCRHDAEDMYQNLFLHLILRPPPDQRHILAYLKKAIRHQAADVARHTLSYSDCVARYAALRRDHAFDNEPADILIQIERVHRLVDAIESTLPPHIAQAILGRYLCGRTISETAVQLGVDERTVSHYCCTGLRRIRGLVQEGKIQIGTG